MENDDKINLIFFYIFSCSGFQSQVYHIQSG